MTLMMMDLLADDYGCIVAQGGSKLTTYHHSLGSALRELPFL